MPALEALGHLLAILEGREPVASRAEVLGDGTIGREEPLRVPGRLEPLHAPLPLAGGLMGVFSPIVQIAVLAVLHTGQDFPLRGTVAGEKDFVQVPLVTGSGTPMPELIGILLAKLATAFPDRFVGHDHPAGEQQLFDVSVAEAEPEVQPNTMTDDLRWKSVIFVGGG
jgi:hypothetical protein